MKPSRSVRFCAPFAGSSGAMISLGNRVAVALHTVTSYAPSGEWCTDEDMFSVVLLEARGDTFDMRAIEIPLRFGMRPTGANDAKRVFELERHVTDGIVCSLLSPFSDARGWGNERYLFRFDLRTEIYERLVAMHGRTTPVPLGDVAEPPALSIYAKGGGDADSIELGTPVEPHGLRYWSGIELDWKLYAKGQTVLDLEGCDACIRTSPALAGMNVTKTFALRGVSLDVGGVPHLAVAARAFLDAAPYRDFLVVIADS